MIEFSDSLLIDQLVYQTLLDIHNWSNNKWMYTFNKGISSMGTTSNFIKNVNGCFRVHFP